MSKLIMIGLPSAGKSTFLGALWHVIDSEEVHGSLKQGLYSRNREYIENLRRKWQSCEALPRTQGGARETVQMQVKDAATERTADLYFPDMAGEIFKEQWCDRRWTKEYAQQIENVIGLLLVVHAGVKYKPDFLADFSIISEDDVTDEEEVVPEVFSMEKACRQAQLVDVLQFHQSHLANASPIRVGVLVTAWDIAQKAALATNELVTPGEYVSRHVPLLDQFLRSNPETIESRIWGISAQGAPIDNPEDRRTLFEKEVASERIAVVPAEGMPLGSVPSHDITDPIRWVAML